MEKSQEMSYVADELRRLGITQVSCYEPLCNHTTWQIGGLADIFIQPTVPEDILIAVAYSEQHQIPLHIIGKGSNVLVSDQGLAGIVLKLADNFNRIAISGDFVEAQAGALITDVVYQSGRQGLAGLAFAEGIPGSVGGAVVMNAGAYGGYLSQWISEITCCNRQGEWVKLDQTQAQFAYRSSIFKQHQGLIILSVTFQLEHGDPEIIHEQMAQFHEKRQSRQPLQLPSAGSVFKNPEGASVAKIIEAIGAKGWRVGDAQVSTMHSNFIVNLGGSTCQDVLTLIERIKQAVLLEHGIELETEVLLLDNKK